MIDIRFDKRTELLSVVFYLSNYHELIPFLVNLDEEHSLKSKAEAYFDAFRDHPCITLFSQLVEEGKFNCDAPVDLFLQMTPDLKGYELEDYPYRTRLDSSPLVPQLMDAAVDFAAVSDFEGFYASNTDFYREAMEKMKDSPLMEGDRHMTFDAQAVTDFLERLYGPELMHGREYGIIILSGGANGHFGPTVDGRITHVAPMLQGNPVVYDLLTIHEFSHPVINPLVDKYLTAEQINSETLFSSIREQMKKIAYSTVDVIVKEHMVRTAEVVFAWVHDGEEARDREIRKNERLGFRNMRFLAEKLFARYQHPDGSFESFYQQLQEEFLQLTF